MIRALGLLLAASVVTTTAAAQDWIVDHRAELPRSGTPLELATIRGDADPLRIELSGSYSFLLDGSEIDALSATVSGRRDVAAGPFVTLPEGTRVISSDPVAHRYVLEIPRADFMPLALNVSGLAARHLITASEARASLQGTISVAHLVPPPPPPSAGEHVATAVADTASGVPAAAWAGGSLGALSLFGLALVWMRRRRAPIAILVRRGHAARAVIGREVLAIGPAYDPVSASAERLVESVEQLATHHRAIDAAKKRTASMATARRAELDDKQRDVRRRLEELVDRLEDTATQLAARAADEAQASGVDGIVAGLDADLEAAVSAEQELARV